MNDVTKPAGPPPSETIRIFVGDDHGVVRDGVRFLISRTEGMELIGEASNGRTLVDGVINTRPDVVVTDIAMPELNGIDAIRLLRERGFTGALVLLSSHDERRYVDAALAAGALAYVHKDDTFDRLLEAIHSAHRGEPWLSPRLSGAGEATTSPSLTSLLSLREREVLQLLAEGNNTKETAHKLSLSPKTVEFHRLNLFSKLKANGLADLVRIAIKEGIVQL